MSFSILITGAAGVTARAVARSIRKSKYFSDVILIGSDTFDNKYELLGNLYDKFYNIPMHSDLNYEFEFMRMVDKENPDAILLIPENEVVFWASKNKLNTIIPNISFCLNSYDKYKLHEILDGTGIVADSIRLDDSSHFEEIWKEKFNSKIVWVRGHQAGSSSGKGACPINSVNDYMSWINLNKSIKSYLISEFLPGKNYACCMLYNDGLLLTHCIYERLQYFMPNLNLSGVTGNISLGTLVNDENVLNVSKIAVEIISKISNCTLSGLITIDLKENYLGIPCVTEVNLRPTAATEIFALGGHNMSEFQLYLNLGMIDKIPSTTPIFNKNNRYFRDIDGAPRFCNDYLQLSKIFE
jgi:hypothetical protein